MTSSLAIRGVIASTATLLAGLAMAQPSPEADTGKRASGSFTLDLQVGLGNLAITRWASDAIVGAPVARLMAGFRQNYSPSFGMHFRGGVLLGEAIYTVGGPALIGFDDSLERDSTLMGGAMLEATPYFGPFGGFYVGPTIWAAYLGFSHSSLEAKNEKLYLEDGLGGGLGFDCGVLVGGREQFDINFSFRGDFTRGGSLFYVVGVGYHL